MAEYAITVARKYTARDNEGAPYESYRTTSAQDATHIVHYGDGAMLHATPYEHQDDQSLKKTIDSKFRHVKKVNIREVKPKKDLEGRTFSSVPSGLEVKTLTKPMEWLKCA